MYPRSIPAELCDIIIDHLWDDISSLAACSLTCRSWLAAARFHLFHTVELDTLDTLTSFDRILHDQCSSLSSIAPYVRALSLDMKDVNPELNEYEVESDSDSDSEEERDIDSHVSTTQLMAANCHIIRVTKTLKDVRSLTLHNIDCGIRMLKEDTMQCLLSISQKLETLVLRNLVFENVNQLFQFMEASPRLSTISMKYVWWCNISFPPNHITLYADSSSSKATKSTIETLDMMDCPNSAISAVVQKLRSPSFGLRLRSFSVSAAAAGAVSDIFLDKGATLETLRLDYLTAADCSQPNAVPDLSQLTNLKTLHITSFHLLDNSARGNHERLASMLSTITSRFLDTIIFSHAPWTPSWGMNAGWAALDATLTALAKRRPQLRLVFSFNAELPPCPRSTKTLVLESALRTHLPLYLEEGACVDVTMTQVPDAIYGHRVVRL